jgi:hypothetical protein
VLAQILGSDRIRLAIKRIRRLGRSRAVRLTGAPACKVYWLEIVAVVPSNLVKWTVNFSL